MTLIDPYTIRKALLIGKPLFWSMCGCVSLKQEGESTVISSKSTSFLLEFLLELIIDFFANHTDDPVLRVTLSPVDCESTWEPEPRLLRLNCSKINRFLPFSFFLVFVVHCSWLLFMC